MFLIMITRINYAEDVLCLKAYNYQGLGRAEDLGHAMYETIKQASAVAGTR